MSSITVSSLVLGSLTVEVDGSDSILALSVLGTAPASLSIELGTPGATGTAATIAVGTTTTLSPGASATVANVGTSSAAVFNFGIPTGPTGPTGATGATGSPGTAATIAAGTTTTGAPGSSASVTNSGTSGAAVFDFTIPRGDVGATGATGATGAVGPGVAVGGTTGQLLAKASGTNYDTTWTTVVPGDRYLTTSTTSLTLSNANKTLTVGTGLSYTPTQNITIAYNASNHMHGEVLTYDSGTGVMTVDVNNHTGSGTYAAWTVNVGGVTPVTSTAWGAITGTLSAQTDLQTALDLKAPLASPALTGTPTAPTASAATSTTQLATTAFVTTADNLKANLASPTFTGTPAAPTATAGTNTTQLATTAFVTAATPAASTTVSGLVELATSEEAILGASTTLTPTSFSAKAAIMSSDWSPIYRAGFTATTSGTGAGCTLGWTNTLYQLPTSGSTGHSYARTYGTSQIDQLTNLWGDDTNIFLNFAKRIWISGRNYITFPAISNMIARVTFGKAEANGVGDLAVRGIGWKYTTGASQFVQLMVHNGTTLTTVNSSFTPTSVAFSWDIISEGNGNVTLYINGSSVATTSAGPSTRAVSTQCLYQEEAVVNGTIPNAFCRLYGARGAIYVQR